MSTDSANAHERAPAAMPDNESTHPADSDDAAESVDLEHEPRKGKGPKLRKARDPERRAQEADAEAIRRELRKALATRDGDKLKKLRASVGAGDPADDAGPTKPAPATKPATDKPAAGSSWPAPGTVAEFRPVASVVTGTLAEALKGTRYTLDRTILAEKDGQIQEVNAQAALAEALAPVLAKYLPTAMVTPTGNLAMVALAIWAVPAAQHAAELLSKPGPGEPVRALPHEASA